MNKAPLTGIVLAGGKSSRMRQDKGIMELKGKKVVQHVLDALLPVVDEIIIIANNNHYNDLGYTVYEDIIKDCGPIGGIYTGLTYSHTPKNMILSCDIPFITSKTISHIIAESGDYDIAIPEHDTAVEPLCAVYSKTCADTFKKLIDKNEWKMQNALQYFKTKRVIYLNREDINRDFININTPQEFMYHSTE